MYDIKNLTLQEKIGQLLVIGFSGYDYNEHLQEMIEKYKAGNIILFTRNIKDLEQLFNLNKKLYEEIIKSTNTIPLISIDQEGGMVTRIMDGATFFPGNMTLGATEPNNALSVGKMMGEELLSLGINFNLAPVLDVNNNPLNPVIGVRSYSDQPEVVSQYGNKFINALQSTGVLAAGKHFPGHGDTTTDSHYSMTIVPHNKERLQSVELVPFKNAIDAGVDAIMSAHVLFPAYEPNDLPATLSKKVLINLLREELGFTGLVISDCLEMKAIDDYFTTAKAALMGVEAGLDLLCISHTLQKQRDAAILIEKAVQDGSLPMEVLDAKVARILKYKQRLHKLIEKEFLNKEFSDVKQHLTALDNKVKVQNIVDNSLTLVKGELFKHKGRALVIAPEPFATTIAEDQVSSRSIVDRIEVELPEFSTLKIPLRLSSNDISNATKKAKNYDQVVICSYNVGSYPQQITLINEMLRLGKEVHIISTRNPYDFLYLHHVDNFVSLYEYTPNSISTIIKYLNSTIIPNGKMPVKLDVKPEIGASCYVGLKDYPIEENLKYLHLLAQLGIKKLFVSAHIPEMHPEFQAELTQVLDLADKLDLQVILDVSKGYYENLTNIDSVYSLRLDYGFSFNDIIELAKSAKFLIELNASTVTERLLQKLVVHGVDFSRLRISYNFYPKPLTAMTHENIIKRNKLFKNYGLKTMAYIPGTNKRPPVYAGLPTIEEHRNQYIENNLQELALIGVDEIIFGDSFITESELKIALQFDFNILQIPIVIKENISERERSIISAVHRLRIDESKYLKRAIGRVDDELIRPFNTVARNINDVTIDNCNFGRYQGELCIVKEDISEDSRVNVVGRIIASNYLLSHLKPGSLFKFIIKGEES